MDILKVVSGGQTGVDRAALDAALSVGLPFGGWCPKQRRAEDGVISKRYPMRETPSPNYAQRTEWNVRDSDGTLILYYPPLEGGTLHTKTYADRMEKPCLLIALPDDDSVSTIREWMREQSIHTLNIAGPRESKQPGIYRRAYDILNRVFSP